MFDVAGFIKDCEEAVATDRGRAIVRGLIAAAIAKPGDLLAAFADPKLAGVAALHRSPRLTILHVAWPSSYTQTPHNHLTWAEIGVYSGREDQIFWRRTETGARWPIDASGGMSLSAGDCCSLDHDAIHSVTNPLDRVTHGLHVYGGDLPMAAPRSAWNGETLVEEPLDYTRDIRAVETYNARVAKG